MGIAFNEMRRMAAGRRGERGRGEMYLWVKREGTVYSAGLRQRNLSPVRKSER